MDELIVAIDNVADRIQLLAIVVAMGNFAFLIVKMRGRKESR